MQFDQLHSAMRTGPVENVSDRAILATMRVELAKVGFQRPDRTGSVRDNGSLPKIVPVPRFLRSHFPLNPWSQERRIYRLEEFRIRSITPGALHTRRGRLSRDWLQRNAERLGIDRVKTNTREVRRIRREHPTAVQFRREVRDAVLKLNLQFKKL